MNVGETFLNLEYGPEHLWIVVAMGAGGEALIFNFTSHSDGCDDACLVQNGEHPFVHKPTVVAYARGQLLSIETQRAMERLKHNFPSNSSVSHELLERIRYGALASRFTKNAYKSLIRIALGISEPTRP